MLESEFEYLPGTGMGLKIGIGSWAVRLIAITALFAVFDGTVSTQSAERSETPYVKCWEFAIDGALPFPTLAADSSIYVSEPGGRIRAIDSRTGTTQWTNELGGSIASNFLILNRQLFVISNPATGTTLPDRASILWMLSPESGLTLQNIKLPYSEFVYLGETEQSIIVVGAEGVVTAMDSTGTTRWTRPLNSRLTTPPSVSGGRVFIATEFGKILVIDADTGNELAGRQWQRKVTAISLANADGFVIGDERGNVVRFTIAAATPVWKFKAGGSITQIAAAGDELAINSLDNFLYFLTYDSGKVRWRKRLVGRAAHAPLILGDRIVAASFGENSVPISEIRGGKTVNRIELAKGSYFNQIPQTAARGMIVVTVPGSIIAFGNKRCGEN